MPDLIQSLTDAGLSEDQARTACRVVAEWIADQSPTHCGSASSASLRRLLRRAAGETPGQ